MTCDERDKVLTNLSSNDSNKNTEKIKTTKDHYAKKLKVRNQKTVALTCSMNSKRFVLTSYHSPKGRGETGSSKAIHTLVYLTTFNFQNMESEMKRLKTAHREHDRLVKSNKDYEKNMKNLQTELTQMKKNKVINLYLLLLVLTILLCYTVRKCLDGV